MVAEVDPLIGHLLSRKRIINKYPQNLKSFNRIYPVFNGSPPTSRLRGIEEAYIVDEKSRLLKIQFISVITYTLPLISLIYSATFSIIDISYHTLAPFTLKNEGYCFDILW